MPDPLDHLLIEGYTDRQDFKSTLSARSPPPPFRKRRAHGSRLLAQIRALGLDEERLRVRRRELGISERVGTAIALEISPPGSLDVAKKLEWKRVGIEVLSATLINGKEIVVLHVPDGGLVAFEKRVREYLTETVKPKKKGDKPKPKNATLINSILEFRRAAFDELWTDELRGPPADDKAEWFQVWLRIKAGDSKATYQLFADGIKTFDITMESGYVSFPGRVVVAVNASRSQLQNALELLDLVAEIRSVPPISSFVMNLKPFEQVEWAKDLEARSKYPAGDSPYVTLMDTGVNHGHPLLRNVLAENDLHAVRDEWGEADHEGHGTEMAGLSAHGELLGPLGSTEEHPVFNRLESVKILPPDGQNPVHLYGWVMQQAAGKVEAIDDERLRTFAMMTTSYGNTIGLPSEWSATIDSLSYGRSEDANAELGDDPEEDLKPRLYVLAAGNVDWEEWGGYPQKNDLSSVENPAQAWNALTVGSCTNLVVVDTDKYPSYEPIARKGMLSPCSTTSVMWNRAWPFKPDVVAEGGNGCFDNGNKKSIVDGPESLRLATTSHDIAKKQFAETGGTSAAAAEVARLCAHLRGRYPGYWPETIRALVVHGARYTPPMLSTLPQVRRKRDKEVLLGRFGYGRVDADNSTNSAFRKPTLVLQELIQPYKKVDASTRLSDLNLHELPWPADALRDAGDVRVAMRVTLSYFVEPNPSRRGWQSKYRYQSHGLRFAVKGATEESDRFLLRVNQLEREAEQEKLGEGEELESMHDPDASSWFLGARVRSRGSIISDLWMGSAAELAEKSHIAVFPVGGWWKDWPDQKRHGMRVRYALAVSLEVMQDVDIDLYTPIATLLRVPVTVARQ